MKNKFQGMTSDYDDLGQEHAREYWSLAITPTKKTVLTRFPIRDYIQQTHLAAFPIEYER